MHDAFYHILNFQNNLHRLHVNPVLHIEYLTVYMYLNICKIKNVNIDNM